MDDYSIIENNLGYVFGDKNLLLQALTHSSYANDHKTASYERLEFLGDSVLDYITALLLYEKNPDMSEGSMTKIRASLVKEETLSELNEKLSLYKFTRYHEGKQIHSISQSKAVKCDVFEAVIGAILLDSGYNIALLKKNSR